MNNKPQPQSIANTINLLTYTPKSTLKQIREQFEKNMKKLRYKEGARKQ